MGSYNVNGRRLNSINVQKDLGVQVYSCKWKHVDSGKEGMVRLPQ